MRDVHLSYREAQLNREARMAEAEQWRQAHPGYRRRQWHLPQITIRPLLDRVVAWAEELLARPAEPREQCC